MDEHLNSVPHPEILPQADAPVSYGPVKEGVPQTTTQAKKPIPPLVVIGVVIFVLVFGSLTFATKQRKSTVDTTVVTSITPTPTVQAQQNLTPIATTSAFAQFETTINNLPGIIQGATLQDPSILPPVLDLPLGFSN